MSRSIQDALWGGLNEGALGTAYRRQLLQVLDRWVKPDPGVPTINTLPMLTCQASGGDPRHAAPVAAAWQLIRLAAKLLDDVEDGEQSSQYSVIINAAIGLLLAAQLTLGELSAQVSPDRAGRLCQSLHRTVLRACAGQHADLVARQSGMAHMDPDTWLEVAGAKSGELLGWAAWAGALVAAADEPTLACYREYGYHLGVLLQVADDFNDVWHPDGASDLATGRLTLPVCYARLMAMGEERDGLEALLRQAARGDSAAEAQARQLLTDLGSQAYLLVVARVQYQQAMAALERANPAPPAGQQLVALLDQMLPTSKMTLDAL